MSDGSEERTAKQLNKTKRRRGARAILGLLLFALLLSGACQRSTEEGAPGGAANTNAQPAAPATSTITSPCDHPYYPVREGAQWRYRLTTQGIAPIEQTITTSNVTTDTFTERHEFSSGGTMTRGWRCSGDGLSALQYGNFSTPQAAVQMNTIRSEGVTLPAADRWQPGATWESRYEVRGGMAGANNNNPAMEMSGPIEISSRIVGQESVTVPAGTYDAMKVESTFTARLTTSVGGRSMPMNPMAFRTNAWYARGVGVVRIEQVGGFGSTTTELLSPPQ